MPQAGPEPMSEEDASVPDGWAARDGRLVRRLRFGSFPQALGFMVEVGLWCEHEGHHPDWRNSYDLVEVSLRTHDAGRVTGKDVALARHINAVLAGRSARPDGS